ncbi:MAG: class I SAM-dependent methyltransferase [Firmicutes bacterium]|nr:class I SAM-dependent methyltransferase [Bacillota bacterium]
MSRLRAIWGSWPPVLKALAAQGVVFAVLLVMATVLPKSESLWPWALTQGLLAALLAALWGLGRWWQLFQAFLPLALAWQWQGTVPSWVFLALAILCLLVFGGGMLTRVPLYNSNREAWNALLAKLPEDQPWRVADLGAGLGGPLAHWAPRRPQCHFVGVEASPLVWLAAWLRLRRHPNAHMRLGSLWKTPLNDFDLVFVFLSPAPMAALWDKACTEMRPGTLLVSHSFEIPNRPAQERIPVSGPPGACLLFYRIP